VGHFPACRIGAPRHRHFFAESAVSFDFFGPAWEIFPFGAAPFGPFGFGGFVPLVFWNEPGPAPAMVMPPAGVPPNEVRGGAQIVPPVDPRSPTTDIPERLVEDLLGPRRPNLAQRAQAARLEAAGDTTFHAGHFARAADRYQLALAQTPDNDDVRFKRGVALAAAGHYSEAIRVLREALHGRPDWPFVPHDLLTLFPDQAAIDKLLENLDRESRRANAETDLAFLRAYILYFSGRREAAEAIFRNPPGAVVPAHFQLFLQAIERARQGQ
jgi:hypothetical protein